MVVTPIKEENRVVGVLAVFAPTPHAFTITHVAVLKTMADQISALLQRQRNAGVETIPLEASRAVVTPIAAKPIAAPAPSAPPPVVIKPAAAAAAPARAHTPVAKAEPVKAPTPVEVVPLAVPPKREEKRADAQTRANFGTFDSVAGEEKKPANKLMLVGVVAVLLIAAAATFAFLKMQKGNSSAQAQHAQQTASATAPVSSSPQPAGTNGSVTPAPVVTVPATPGKSAAEPESKKSAAKNNDKSSPEKPAPQEKPVQVATVATSGPSRIAQSAASQSADVAPTFTVDNGSSAPNLSTLARPVASVAPTASIEQSQLEPLQLVRTVPPVYPAIAKARHMSGIVVVEATVGKDGRAKNPRFLSGAAIFKDAAFDAVLKYQFKPAKLNGQPIEQTTQVRLNFTP